MADGPVATRQNAGFFACDSATCILCDARTGVGGIPSFEFTERWDDLCELILAGSGDGDPMPGGGVCICTGADGRYDVYAERDTRGALVGYVVDFLHVFCGEPERFGQLVDTSPEQERADTEAFERYARAWRQADRARRKLAEREAVQ